MLEAFADETAGFGVFSEDVLRVIPGCYYLLGIVCGVVLLIFTLMISDELSAAERGGMIGWVVGSVLGMFAVGRIVQLVQRISDDIRVMREGKMNGRDETASEGESVAPSEIARQ